MARGTSCSRYPIMADGEPSEMYKELLRLTKNRPLANLIYASYLQQGVSAQMDSMGYEKNSQDQHSGKDVYTFFNVNRMKSEMADSKIFDTGLAKGTIDSTGKLVDFVDAEQALRIADDINSTSHGQIAYVVQKGDKFNVVINSRTASTYQHINNAKKALQIWDVVKQAFNSVGIDITSSDFNKSVINANKEKGAIGFLKSLQATDNKHLIQRDIELLLQFGKNSTQVQRLEQMFGSIQDAAAKIYQEFRTPGTITLSQRTLAERALDISKNFRGLDINALLQQITSIDQSFNVAPEAEIQQTMADLHRDYGINKKEILLEKKKINSMQKAAEKAAIVMQRQLAKMKMAKGDTQESLQLEEKIRNLMKDLEKNKYYSGILSFLDEASKQIDELEQKILATPQPGTPLERAKEMSATLMEVSKIKSGYLNILEALADIDKLKNDEELSDADKDNIRTTATRLKEFFDSYEERISNARENTFIDIATTFLGDQLSNGTAIVDLVNMAEADSSIFDWLYSMGRVSDPLIAVMDRVIKDAQTQRNKKLNDIALRIRRADRKLKKSGSNSRFMYEDNEYIISDIDWEAFHKAKARYRGLMQRRGYKGLALKEAMRVWEETNTEDRTVDHTPGAERTERVPNTSYRKSLPLMTQAQAEYYKEMMQIKGELGSLLPDYAQRQYVPPQIRRSFNDAIRDAFRNELSLRGLVQTLRDIAKATKNKIIEPFVIREDDENAIANGIIEGKEFTMAQGELDNTPFRQIPIFYINSLKDQEELLKDFSGALQRLAGTAVNFEAMNNIKDTIEFMGDYLTNDRQLSAMKNGKGIVDSVEDADISIFERLVNYSKSSFTEGIIKGFIDKHIYGVRLKNYNKYDKFLRSILSYSSMRSLAINLKGMISNYLVGEIQMLIESGCGEFYNPIDYAAANALVFGDNTIRAPRRMIDFVFNNENSESVLLSRLFDPLLDSYEELSRKRYYRGPIRHLLGTDFTFMGYGAGEHMIHFVNMYAVLHHNKIRINGQENKIGAEGSILSKKYTLRDAFEVTNKQDGNSELQLKQGVEYKDENGNWVPLTSLDDPYIQKIKDSIKHCNQTAHGSMNTEDKGLIHQHMLGRFAMNLRQWMVEHYSRRYRARYWDSTLQEEREGFYNTTYKLMKSWINDLTRFQLEGAVRWKDMDKGQRANVRRALAEQVVLASLYGLSFALGEPEDHKKEFWYRMWIYQTKRSIIDVKGSTPYGIPTEMNTLINSPIAATSTVNAMLYPVVGLGDIDEEVKRGRYKGWKKYTKNMYKYWLPFAKHIEQIKDFSEDDQIFQIFDKQNL